MQPPIDLRSDTVTRPSAAMRAAMAAAEVGDDVFGEDPTVRRLEEQVAAMLGKETALFVPSGTMGNQLGLRVHCQPGDDFLCESNCHIVCYEQGAYAQFFGIAAQPVEGEHGVLQVEQLMDRIHPENDHYTRTRLVTLENTHNRGAGRIQPYDAVAEICGWAAEQRISLAIWMAPAYSTPLLRRELPPPIGPAISIRSASASQKGSAPRSAPRSAARLNSFAKLRRHRKALGGGWRQAGIIAARRTVRALDHNIDRLHRRSRERPHHR